ncbi:MAG TPA: carbonic anhydrase family protein [Steroidobacteraceae bacterium]|nr:carbonic anhydrase family protein [Steroidobacteraceae bacterium]
MQRFAKSSALTALLSGLLLTTAPAARADSGSPHWSYSGENGPDHWASEDPAFATCGVGKRQSPIDIKSAVAKSLPPIEFAYQPTPLTVTDTGHSMQVNAATGSGGITVGGEHYDLLQFHFHRPSEERIHGRRYALVAHLVHRNAKGELAVVAVLIRQGKTNAFLKPVFDSFPSGKPETSVAGATLQLGELLPAQRGYYTFEGSLTTPPCTEHVRWFVLKSPVEASAAQVQQYAAHYPDNARPVQPLNGRLIEETRD